MSDAADARACVPTGASAAGTKIKRAIKAGGKRAQMERDIHRQEQKQKMGAEIRREIQHQPWERWSVDRGARGTVGWGRVLPSLPWIGGRGRRRESTVHLQKHSPCLICSVQNNPRTHSGFTCASAEIDKQWSPSGNVLEHLCTPAGPASGSTVE